MEILTFEMVGEKSCGEKRERDYSATQRTEKPLFLLLLLAGLTLPELKFRLKALEPLSTALDQ